MKYCITIFRKSLPVFFIPAVMILVPASDENSFVQSFFDVLTKLFGHFFEI